VDLGIGSRLVLDIDFGFDLSRSWKLVHFGRNSLLWALEENVDGLLSTAARSSLESRLDNLLDSVVGNNDLDGGC
jgi:hypothetical protein